MPKPVDQGESLYVMRDMMDSQLQTSDNVRIGRVGDVRAEWRDDGEVYLTSLVTGPQALAGRVSEGLRPVARRIFHDRFERAIPLSEVQDFGPTICLSGKAEDYAAGQADRWIARYILRWIPGSGIPWRRQTGNSTSKTSSAARS
jgi:hypothetical protein